MSGSYIDEQRRPEGKGVLSISILESLMQIVVCFTAKKKGLNAICVGCQSVLGDRRKMV